DDNKAFRALIPEQPNRYTQVTLTQTEQQSLESFRAQWCQTATQLRSLQTNEPFYDLGVRCNAYEVKQARVPMDMLPLFFVELLKRLPLVPTPTAQGKQGVVSLLNYVAAQHAHPADPRPLALLDVRGILKARTDLSMPGSGRGRLNASRWAALCSAP